MNLDFANLFFLYKSKCRGKSYLFVDYFDTFVKTIVSPYYIRLQICNVILSKYPSLKEIYTPEEFQRLRDKAVYESRKKYDDAPYKVLVELLYEYIDGSKYGISKEEFYYTCYEGYKAVVIGCQYLNIPIKRFIDKCKKNGMKICLVSDYYLPKEAYDDFLDALNCSDVFDEIFVSSTINCSKFRGTIYPYVTGALSTNPCDCLMIGDNKKSDYLNAIQWGIDAIHYKPYIYKLKHKLQAKFKHFKPIDAVKRKITELNKRTEFDAYAIGYVYFIHQLYKKACIDKSDQLLFVSRDGLALKKMFDDYQKKFVPFEKHINTNYFYNSRIVNHLACDSLNKDRQDYFLLKQYIESFASSGRIFLVDNGWKCSSQQIINKLTDIPSVGYYIGVTEKPEPFRKGCVRNGLLFDVDENSSGKKSKYYGILQSNRLVIYEQFLLANTGTLNKYIKLDDGSIGFDLADEPKNLELYNQYIKGIQTHLFYNVVGLSSWLVDYELSRHDLAKIILKLLFNQSKTECRLFNEIFNNRFELFDKLTKVNYDVEYNGQTQKFKNIPWHALKDFPVDFIIHPDRVVHFLANVPRMLVEHPILFVLSKPLLNCYYLYTRLICKI